MTIVSVQNFLKKCHNKTFLFDMAFSRPLYYGNMKSCVDMAFWDETKSFLQYKGASVELNRAKTPANI